MTLVVRAIAPQLGPWPDRLVNGLLTPGAWKPADAFKVAAPGGMFIRVGSGTVGDLAAVEGSATAQGTYLVANPDGALPDDLPISPGDPSDPRVDLVVLRVYDDEWDSTGRTEAVVEVVEGDPSSSPSAPATPASSIALAEVLVAAGESTAIAAGDITDRRPRARVDPDLVDHPVVDHPVARLDHQVLAAATASVTIAVPADYDHLRLVASGEMTANGPNNMLLRFNGDTGANYNSALWLTDQAGATSVMDAGVPVGHIRAMRMLRHKWSIVIDILDHANPAREATAIANGWAREGSTYYSTRGGGHWRQSTPVTEISLGSDSTPNFLAGSVFSLYGIRE